MRALLAAAALAGLSACSSVIEPPPSPPTTLRVAQDTGCFTSRDCSNDQLCVDPRYPVCGAIPSCEDGGILCGCACKTACTATSCGPDEVCGPSGCCQPKPCAGDTQCVSPDGRCVEGRCVRRGTCTLPPP